MFSTFRCNPIVFYCNSFQFSCQLQLDLYSLPPSKSTSLPTSKTVTLGKLPLFSRGNPFLRSEGPLPPTALYCKLFFLYPSIYLPFLGLYWHLNILIFTSLYVPFYLLLLSPFFHFVSISWPSLKLASAFHNYPILVFC